MKFKIHPMIVLALVVGSFVVATPVHPVEPTPVRVPILYGSNQIDRGPINSEPNLYGWAWGQPVKVYDGTPQPNNWKVSEAVTEWTKGGINASMTTDQTQAQIVITEQFDQCGVTDPFATVLGCAYTPPLSNGVAYGVAYIHLNPNYDNHFMSEHVAIHEIGHTIGLATYYGNSRSVMKPAVSDTNYLTRPAAVDIRDVHTLYGR